MKAIWILIETNFTVNLWRQTDLEGFSLYIASNNIICFIICGDEIENFKLAFNTICLCNICAKINYCYTAYFSIIIHFLRDPDLRRCQNQESAYILLLCSSHICCLQFTVLLEVWRILDRFLRQNEWLLVLMYGRQYRCICMAFLYGSTWCLLLRKSQLF